MNKLALSVSAIMIAAAGANAAVIWDEGVNGDLSNDELAAPTVLGALAVGSNEVIATIDPFASPIDEFDSFTFDVPAGTILDQVILTSYSTFTGGDGTSGIVAWDGPNATAPFLGGAGFGAADAGSDIITTYDPSGDLGPGTYTFSIREFGGPGASYSLDFVVVPTPGAAGLLAVAGLAAARRRR